MDRHAFFQELAGAESPLAFKPEHEPRLERLRARLGALRGKRVFEPGCGAGPLTERLAHWVGPEGHVLALDSCPGMVARCGQAVADGNPGVSMLTTTGLGHQRILRDPEVVSKVVRHVAVAADAERSELAS